MFINREELERRRREENNLAERMKVPAASSLSSDDPIAKLDTSKFKKDGTEREMPVFSPETRALAAATCLVAGPEVAEEVTGVSARYSAVLARGEYSTALDPEVREQKNQELREQIYEALGKIRGRASRKLMKVLNLINDETLQAIPDKDKARLAAQMANQLSGVIDRTINKGEGDHADRSTHLHLYAPEKRTLADFNIKRVNALPEAADATSSAQ